MTISLEKIKESEERGGGDIKIKKCSANEQQQIFSSNSLKKDTFNIYK